MSWRQILVIRPVLTGESISAGVAILIPNASGTNLLVVITRCSLWAKKILDSDETGRYIGNHRNELSFQTNRPVIKGLFAGHLETRKTKSVSSEYSWQTQKSVNDSC